MSRSGPSVADRQLLADAAAAGHPVTHTQLERWRSMHLVPRNVRHGSGRGRGSVSVAPDGALELVIAAAASARQGKKMTMADPLMLAATARPFRAGTVKTAVTKEFDDACATLGADLDARLGPDAAGDARYELATRATARGPWPLMRSVYEYVATGAEMPERRAPRRAMGVLLQSVASGGRDVSLEHLTAAGKSTGHLTDSGDTGDPDINQIWARLEASSAMPAWMTRELAHADAAAQGDAEFEVDLLEALGNWSLAAMRNHVRNTDEADLVAAVKSAVIVASLQTGILLFGLPGRAGEPQIVPDVLAHWAKPAVAHAMVSDPMYKLWTHNWPAPNGSRNWLRVLAFQAGLVAILGLTAELDAYAARLQAVLHPHGPETAAAATPPPLNPADDTAVVQS